MFEDVLKHWLQEAIRAELNEVSQKVEELAARLKNTGSAFPVFLTADDVASLTKVRPQTVRSWVSSGSLPAHYAGRKLRIRLDELEAFMQREKGEPLSSTADDDDRVREILASINE